MVEGREGRGEVAAAFILLSRFSLLLAFWRSFCLCGKRENKNNSQKCHTVEMTYPEFGSSLIISSAGGVGVEGVGHCSV